MYMCIYIYVCIYIFFIYTYVVNIRVYHGSTLLTHDPCDPSMSDP